MENQLRIKLGRLASVDFQRQLCISETRSEYILPSEILESAANATQTVLASPTLAKHFDSIQLKSLREFLGFANDMAPKIPFDDEAVSVQDLIENNETWGRIRLSAQKCMGVLGFKITLAELLELS